MLKEFGQDLKALRESKNITIAEISSETRINPKFLLNFEAGIFDFQPETYIRSFLREYASSLGENEYAVLHDYEKAKSGFYVKKNLEEQSVPSEEMLVKEEEELTTPAVTMPDREKSLRKKEITPKEEKVSDNYYPPPKNIRQKIIIGIIIVAVIAGIYFLYNYLNRSNQKTSSEIKPKSFSEMSEDYENKIKGKNEKEDSLANLKNVNTVKNDSLILTVKAAKEVRIKVYLDEGKLVEDIIQPKDSLTLRAKEKFRFSSSSNQGVDLYLNGKYLQKSKTSSTSTSIKNLEINKDGIITQ